MKVAQPIADLLAEHLVGWLNPAEFPCEGSLYHSPRPLSVRKLQLTETRAIYLCPTCLDNLRKFIYLSVVTQGLDWTVERCFGSLIRHLACRKIEDGN